MHGNLARVILILSVLLLLTPVVSAQEKPKKLLVLANSIDSELAGDFFNYIESQGIEPIQIKAADFESFKTKSFIIILGGPDAYEGVGDIVREVLTPTEQDYLRVKGNKKAYVKTDVWSTGQMILVLAGSDRAETREVHVDKRDILPVHLNGPSSVLDFAIYEDEYPSGFTGLGMATSSNPKIKEDAERILKKVMAGTPHNISDALINIFNDEDKNVGITFVIQTLSSDVAKTAAENIALSRYARRTRVGPYEVYYSSSKYEAYWSVNEFLIFVIPDTGQGYTTINQPLKIVEILLAKTGRPTYPAQ